MQFRHKLLFLAITAATVTLTGCGGTSGKGSAVMGASCLTATGCSGGTGTPATATAAETCTATGCSGSGTGTGGTATPATDIACTTGCSGTGTGTGGTTTTTPGVACTTGCSGTGTGTGGTTTTTPGVACTTGCSGTGTGTGGATTTPGVACTTGCSGTGTGTGGTGTTGAEGDDGEHEDGSDSDDAPRTVSRRLAIDPSLGEIHYATINVYDASLQLLASSYTGEAGNTAIEAAFDVPVVVEVTGDSDAVYFDEAAGTMLPFSSGTLHALAPAGSTGVGVTVLTELAWQLLHQSGAPLTNDNVLLANEAVRRALAPDLGSILTPPIAWNASTAAGSLPATDAGEYALLLGAFAQLGSGAATPALAIIAQLDADLADGILDALAPPAAAVAPGYTSTATLAATLRSNVRSMAASYGNTDLQQRVNLTVDNLTFTIVPPKFTGGG